MMTISIIIPVFKVEPYIERCIKSIIDQETDGCAIECILVDDCTPDNSMLIARELIDAYEGGGIRFVCLRHEVNRGLSAARNTGLKEAMGDYVLFVDSDDWMKPQSIQYFLDCLSEHPSVDIVVGNVGNGRDYRDRSLLLGNLQKPLFIDDRNEFFSRMLHHRIYNYAWNKLIRRSVLLDNKVFFIDGILYEDIPWSYHLFSHLKSILLLPKETYVYEDNPGSIVNTTFSVEKADKAVKSFAVICHYLLDNPPSPSRYVRNLTVDYLLYVMNWQMKGANILSKCSISDETVRDFRAVRLHLLSRSLRYGRVLLSCFFLLLFPPLCYLQRLRIFRHHYHNLQSAAGKVFHLTDFLHRKDKQ